MGSRLQANSEIVRKRIQSHTFDDENGDEYEASSFGGFSDYFRRKKLKLQNRDADIRASSENNPPIFRGVVAHVNGYTQPSLRDLNHLIVSHGGGFLQYLGSKTSATHIISSSLTPKKYEEFRKYRIVKPAWVVDSVEAGRLLPWDNYRVVDGGVSQKVLKFEDGALQTRANEPERSYRDQTDNSWYTSQLKSSQRELEDQSIPVSSLKERADTTSSFPNSTAETDYGEFPSLISPPEAESKGTAVNNDSEVVIEKLSNAIENQTEGLGREEATENGKGVQADAQLVRETIPVPPDMSPEEYNALLLSDPRVRQSSVVNPDFLQQYYRESRLHHLSTWKAELKAKLQAITQKKTDSEKNTKRHGLGARRYILHVDFDSFFAAVSIQKHHLELIDKPVAIAHGTGNGSEIASCNYPARAFGIKNGMWMKGALDQCPTLKILQYDFPAYEEASRQFYECILAIDGIVQSVSIDEALVDITEQCLQAGGSDGCGISEGSIYREQAKADEIAKSLRNSIKDVTGCAVSVGIGGNILQAKVALRKAKPAGQFQLKPDEVLSFWGDLTVQDLPGVAYSLGGKLEEIGVKFVKDLRDVTRERLISHLGPKTGAKLWDYARGIDKTEVGIQTIRKSVSAEINWGIRFVNQTQAEDFVQNLSNELHRRLVENLVKGKQLTIRVMKRSADAPLDPVKHLGHGKCDVFNKSVLLGVATNAGDIIGKEAIAMLRSFSINPGDLRGLGVQMTKLEQTKSASAGRLEGSQQQLNFKKSPVAQRSIQSADLDLLDSPHKGDGPSVDAVDALDNRPTFDSSLKPLNVSGTQFIMPTQPDPKVVAELPTDIRSMLVRKPSAPRDSSPSPAPRHKVSGDAQLPSRSQIDPEILKALPEDIQSEILEYYAQPSNENKPESPQQPPQSPPAPSHPLRAATGLKRPTTPVKKRRGRPPKSSVNVSRPTSRSNLTQSSFNFSRARQGESETPPVSNIENGSEISEEFLAALPVDIREEILQEQRQHMLQQANLVAPASRKPVTSTRPTTPAESSIPATEKRLQLSPRPEQPTFTSKKLTAPADLREAVTAWYSAFTTEAPFVEDAEALALYLKRVILEERDLEKAVSVAEWLAWLIKNGADNNSIASRRDELSQITQSSQLETTWDEALKIVQRSVIAAVEERGLPPPEFST